MRCYWRLLGLEFSILKDFSRNSADNLWMASIKRMNDPQVGQDVKEEEGKAFLPIMEECSRFRKTIADAAPRQTRFTAKEWIRKPP